jgi:hypothetical protein
LNQGGQFALAHSPVAAESRQSLAECGAGREIATDELKAKVVKHHLPRVEVASALLQETNGPLSQGDLGGQLTLGEAARLAVLSQGGTELKTGKKFAQSQGPRGPKPARSLINLSLKWEG